MERSEGIGESRSGSPQPGFLSLLVQAQNWKRKGLPQPQTHLLFLTLQKTQGSSYWIPEP